MLMWIYEKQRSCKIINLNVPTTMYLQLTFNKIIHMTNRNVYTGFATLYCVLLKR